jgi:uncharacterized oligopeptide transporter (OPT) family protein
VKSLVWFLRIASFIIGVAAMGLVVLYGFNQLFGFPAALPPFMTGFVGSPDKMLDGWGAQTLLFALILVISAEEINKRVN